jgi:hypothetical protein
MPRARQEASVLHRRKRKHEAHEAHKAHKGIFPGRSPGFLFVPFVSFVIFVSLFESGRPEICSLLGHHLRARAL